MGGVDGFDQRKEIPNKKHCIIICRTSPVKNCVGTDDIGRLVVVSPDNSQCERVEVNMDVDWRENSLEWAEVSSFFSKHIEQTANKALGKLNILRKLSGTSWGSRLQTLKSPFCTVIRPVLEYATPIWIPTSISVKRKLDSVQHRAAKIIIGAVSTNNYEKAEQECGLPPLESRRNLSTIKFTNKLRSYGLDHISRRILINGSILQGSKDLRLSNLIVKSENSSIWNIPHWSSLRSPLFHKRTKEHLFRIGIVAAMFQKKKTL
ncbi:reverse transcriptase domain-containing protein [Trichonephila clavipes]|uniref:Reverse transcriptase domain-containing protein n=1 Tax=Trichonephila clavipes TaxID=2585209 RepID=A0A8X6SAV0_TRICX|nr:reverse transcriptase domain-containing protein [Trichonephila clavipes]